MVVYDVRGRNRALARRHTAKSVNAERVIDGEVNLARFAGASQACCTGFFFFLGWGRIMQTRTRPTQSGRYRWSRIAERIEGGFILLDMAAFHACWSSYRSGQIQLVDVRIWFAVVELLEERRLARSRRRPCYKMEELAKLTGCDSTRGLKAALGRLERAGLVTWNDKRPRLRKGESTSFGRPFVPLPRRLLKWLTKSATQADVATAVAHCEACLFYWRREKHVESGGYCKAVDVAGRFGLSERSVKRSRRKLADMGWLAAVADGKVGGRSGARFTADVTWRYGRLSPQTQRSRTVLSPPKEDHETSSGVRTKNRVPRALVHNFVLLLTSGE